MSLENVRLVEQVQALLASDNVAAAVRDEREFEELRVAIADLVEPDFETVMIGPDYLPTERHARGIDGFRDSWADWTNAFDRFEIEVEEVIDAGDRVLALVKQRGWTKTGGAEIEARAAAVWTVRDGKLARVEFHLDQDVARRSAGLSEEEAGA